MNRKLSASLALLAFLTQNAAWAKTYSVKKGDTLSHIAAREFGRPIYGPKGSLQKLLQKNPEITNPDRIKPQQSIRLSDDPVAEVPATEVKAPEPQPVDAVQESAPVTDSASSSQASDRSFGVKLGLGLVKDEMEASGKNRSFKTTRDSESQPALDLDVYYKPSEDSRIGVSVGIKNGEYKDSNDGRFEGKSKALSRLSLFGDLTVMDRLHLGLELGTEQSFFFQQLSATDFGLKSVFVDFAEASVGYDLLVHEGWRWNLAASGGYHAAADAGNLDVNKGSSYSAATGLSYEWASGYSLEGTLEYGRRKQGIEGIRQTVTERSAALALRYEF